LFLFFYEFIFIVISGLVVQRDLKPCQYLTTLYYTIAIQVFFYIFV